jgi:hypothetical protein
MEQNIQQNELNKEIGVREILLDDREIKSFLQTRSKYADKQLKIIKEMRKLEEEYNELQKIISKFNEQILDAVYKKYLHFFNEFEDIYEVRIGDKGKIVLKVKDAVEEIKVLARDKFLENRVRFEKKASSKNSQEGEKE